MSSLNPPEQLRSVDPYSQDRFSSVVNRFTRILTGGEDYLLYPDESFLFVEDAQDTSSNNYITFSPGSAIKDDELIIVTANGIVDFEDDNYYLDNTPGMISEGNYYVVLWYNYARIYSPPMAYYRILRQSEVFETYISNYLFLACAQIKQYGGDRMITETEDDILTEDGDYLLSERSSVPMSYGITEKWYYDPDNPTVGKRNYLTISWIT